MRQRANDIPTLETRKFQLAFVASIKELAFPLPVFGAPEPATISMTVTGLETGLTVCTQ